jgi:tetratricopeptide (TPR) repeat protein
MKIFFHFMVVLAIYLIWRKIGSLPGWSPSKNYRIKFPLFKNEVLLNSDASAALLALLFAIHPACSECVNYISATTSLQCAMFYVWAYYGYLKYRESRSSSDLLFSLLLYFFSVASKEEGITLPAIVAISEIFFESGNRLRKVKVGIRNAIPFCVLGILLALWIYWMHPPEGNESRGYVSPFQYFMTQWRAYLWYMKLWFWPWELNADNAVTVFSKSFFEPLVIQSFIGNIILISFGWVIRKKVPAFLFGLVWFYVTISPASSVVVLAEAINEHRMYLAYVGFIGGVFALLFYASESIFDLEGRSKKTGAIFALVVVGLFIGTQERNRVWSNDETLWIDTVEKNPMSGRALNNLSLVYLARHEYGTAIQYLRRCEAYWIGYAYCPLNLGISYLALGAQAKNEKKVNEASEHFALAEQALVRAYQLSPRNVHINFHLARVFDEVKNDYLKATEFYSKAIEITGGRFPMAEIRVASCLRKLGRLDEAFQFLNHALTLEPQNEFALDVRGELEMARGDFNSASKTYQSLIGHNPGHISGLLHYGQSEVGRLNFLTAKMIFTKLVSIDPKNEEAWLNLSLAAEKEGDFQTALNAAQSLVQLSHSSQVFQRRLRKLERKLRK